jgi:hypothetical protein
MSSGTPHSWQAQGAPLDLGEWPCVYWGTSLFGLYLPDPQVSSVGLTGKEAMPFDCPKAMKVLSSSHYGCCCNGCCHVCVTQGYRPGDEADEQAYLQRRQA